MRAFGSDIDLPKVEAELLDHWEKNQCFQESNRRRSTDKTYSFYDGPPFANGLPHYGHMLGQTLKDIVPRYWNMRGFYVERRFGWDCHGLPVEFEVEKKLKLNGRKDILNLGVEAFNEECRRTVFHYADEWKRTVTRLGRWVDWNHQYRTMDLSFMESVWWAFAQLHQKGLVYRDMKIVAYSPRITAVMSNFEANQNYKDVQDPSVFVKFKLKDREEHLIAWTTTPWTLVSNLALVVNPDFTYARVRFEDRVYIVAEALIDQVFKVGKAPAPVEKLSTLSGRDLVGQSYDPLFPYFKDQPQAFRVLEGSFVTLESGSGIVHAAPAYGEEDFKVCKKNGIGLVDPLDEEAKFTSLIPEYAGMYIKDADKLIIRRLKENHQLHRQDVIVHSYPHCDRTEDPLIYRAIPTWYVAVEKFRDELVANNQKINWVPHHLKDGRMGKWLENARDWAISRNRFWGTPIPIWMSDQDENHLEVIGSVAELEKKTGIKITDLHKHHIDALTWKDPKTGATMRRIPEVFDCWFESGSMPYAQQHFPFENEAKFSKAFPADFIAEGQDQTRGWFYTLSILSTALFQKPAFKNVVVNGIVLAADGKKMSKRLQNYTPPEILLNQYGADSVRLYMINSAVLRGEDLKFSDEGVRDITRAVILPLWNAFSFLSTYAEADGWTPDAQLIAGGTPAVDHEMDRWLLSRLQSLKQRVHAEMEAYRIYQVIPEFVSFVDELTNWYIRLNRRRFWGENGERGSPQAYATLFAVLQEFAKLFAPFAPFISEKLYQCMTEGKGEVSVHLCSMPLVESQRIDEALEAKMTLIRKVAGLARSLRAKHQIRTKQVLPELLIITRQETDRQHITSGAEMIRDELNVKNVRFSSDESQFVKLSMKPNLKTLGKKLGKDLQRLKTHLEEMSQKSNEVSMMLNQLDDKGAVTLLGFELGPEDFLIDRGPKDHRLIATEGGITVLLDTTLTPELMKEGYSREVISRIQKMRKDLQLHVSDRIVLHVFAEGLMADAVNDFQKIISSETLATRVETRSTKDGLVDADIEGQVCFLQIEKV